MKVIKNNYIDTNMKHDISIKYPVHMICENCSSELEVTKEDTHIGYLGFRYVTCPCCGEEICVDEFDHTVVTVDNIKFPVYFIRTNKDLREVVEVDDNKVTEYVKDGIKYLRENKDEFSYFVTTGDVFVVVFRFEDDKNYLVLVTKDFYESYLDFEEEDY